VYIFDINHERFFLDFDRFRHPVRFGLLKQKKSLNFCIYLIIWNLGFLLMTIFSGVVKNFYGSISFKI